VTAWVVSKMESDRLSRESVVGLNTSDAVLFLKRGLLCESKVIELRPEDVGIDELRLANISMSFASERNEYCELYFSSTETDALPLRSKAFSESDDSGIGLSRFSCLFRARSSLSSSRCERPRSPNTESLMHQKKNKQCKILQLVSLSS
jgi:hypothetical protein